MIRLHHAVYSEVSKSFRLVRFLDRFVQQVQIFTRRSLHLESAHRLVEVYRERDPRQVLAYGVLDDGPDTELDLRVLKER